MQSYESRMSSDWLDDLKPLGTDWQTFSRNRSSSSSFSDEYMNLALTAKEKQLLRSRKCGHSRWIFFGGNTSSRFGFFNPYPSPMNFLTKIADLKMKNRFY
jgi:hypothetical protein